MQKSMLESRKKAKPVSALRSTGKDIWSKPASNSLKAKNSTTNARAKKIATGSGRKHA